MRKLLVLTAICVTLLFLNYTNVKASEDGVAGISILLDNTSNEEVKTAFNFIYNWTTERLNLRTNPTTESEVIVTLDKRVQVIILSEEDEWSYIKYKGLTGWVCSYYLRNTELPNTNFTDDEIEMLQRITEAEATGQSVQSKSNVASTIINRVISTKFPDDIESVIFQDDQFSPVSDKRYFKVDITEDTIKAVNRVLKDGVTHDCLYFCNLGDVKRLSFKQWFSDLTFVFKDDSEHSYYR